MHRVPFILYAHAFEGMLNPFISYISVSMILRLLLGSQGNTITLAHPIMSHLYRNMEGSGKHRFHGLEHDSKMRLFKIYSHTSTLRGYEASGRMLK